MSDKNLAIVVKFAGQDKLSGVLQLLTGQAGKAKTNLKHLNDTLKLERDELSKLKTKIGELGVPTKQMIDGQARLERQIEDTTAKIKSQKDAMAKMVQAQARSASLKQRGEGMMSGGGAAIIAGASLAAPIALAAKDAISLESAFADVRKVLDFPTASMSALNKDILDMSTRIPIAAEGLAQIAATAGRAGVGQELLKNGQFDKARSELMLFTETAAKMGVAFDMSAEDAGQTMSTWRAAFGINQSAIVALGDQINTLTNRFGGAADQVTEMITRVGPLGKIAGVTAPQMAAMAHVMNQVGIQSEIGATGLKNMMLNMTKGAAATKEQKAAFKSLGLDAKEVSEAMQKDAGSAILNVMDRLNKLPKAEQAGTLTRLFGSESVAAIAPLLGKLDQLKTNFNLVGNSANYAGSMNKEFEARIATTGGAIALAQNAIRALNIEMGKSLLPVIQKTSSALVPITNGFRLWSEKNKGLSQGLMMFAAIGASLVIALGAIGVAAGAASFAFGALGITTWAALWPVLAVIAAVAALIALFTQWDAISAWWDKTWKSIIASFKSINWAQLGMDILSGLISGLFGGLPKLLLAIGKITSTVAGTFKNLLGIKSPSRVFMGFGGHITEGLRLGIKGGAGSVLNEAASLAKGIITSGKPSGISSSLSGSGLGSHLSAGSARQNISLTINIPVSNYQNPSDIGREVTRQIADYFRGRGPSRAAYADDPA